MLVSIALLTVWTIAAVWAVAIWTDELIRPSDGGIERVFDS
jgi:hypothetical protein